jgi:hypothetical protein
MLKLFLRKNLFSVKFLSCASSCWVCSFFPVDYTPVDLFFGYCFRRPPRVKRSALVLFESTASSRPILILSEVLSAFLPAASGTEISFLQPRFCRPVSILLRPPVLVFSSLHFVGFFLELVSSAWLSAATFVGFLPCLCICFPQQHC